MSRRIAQNGFSIIEGLIVVAVVALIGFLGYSFYVNQQNSQVAENNSQDQSRTATDVSPAPAIESTDDLSSAESTLDNTDPEGSNDGDARQLDSSSSEF